MRSQDQRNKSPRPLKFNSSERGWSGGRKHNASPPPVKMFLGTVKKSAITASPDAAKPAVIDSEEGKTGSSASSGS